MSRKIALLALVAFTTGGLGAREARAFGRLAAARAARSADASVAAGTLPAPEVVQPLAVAGPTAGFPQPGLTYLHRGPYYVSRDCAPPIETVLTATHPCTGCPVAIPVCVPACCTGAPCVTCRRGLFGVGVAEFDWACGYRVVVRFKHTGEVVVVSRG
ncbi:MAG TPA: hypothetical protein VFI31_12580 [Pirellulales bacterium]|nr:hypothetical protein [Pirellulales bacterium]